MQLHTRLTIKDRDGHFLTSIGTRESVVGNEQLMHELFNELREAERVLSLALGVQVQCEVNIYDEPPRSDG